MIEWQDILAILLVAAACVYVFRHVRKTMRPGGGCGCSKGDDCPSSLRARRPDSPAIRRIPLVTVNPPDREADDPPSTP